jgi:hypothetical protein
MSESQLADSHFQQESSLVGEENDIFLDKD